MTERLEFFFKRSGRHRDLHSFPTRRSSDLMQQRKCTDGILDRRDLSRIALEKFQTRRHVGEEITRSEEHTSELQSQSNLVCRLLLEKKKNHTLHERRMRELRAASEDLVRPG